MTELPTGPWKKLSADFCGQFPTGEYLLCVMDDYSCFPIVEIVHSMSARTVIPVLDKLLSTFGNILELKTDNGPPFNSEEFRNFTKYFGFHHRKCTPLWPRANGEIERFVKMLEKSLRCAIVEQENWKRELNTFLRAYRTTPHTTTNRTPAELLFGRTHKTRLSQYDDSAIETPLNNTSYTNVHNRGLHETDRRAKNKMKVYSDRRNHAQPLEIKVGDVVLVAKPPTNKLSSSYDSRPYTVVPRKGTLITASRDNHSITRNVSFFSRNYHRRTYRRQIQNLLRMMNWTTLMTYHTDHDK
jgi:hypothetical protein